MFSDAGIAQLVEQLIRNQQVGGSNPLPGSIIFQGVSHHILRSTLPDCIVFV